MTPGQSASRSAGTEQTRLPDPRHMNGVWDLLGRETPHGLACSCGTMRGKMHHP